jgi:gliding motility-associated-like protein
LISGVALFAQKHNLLPDTIPLCLGDSASIEIRHEYGNQATIRWVTPRGVINNTRKIRAVKPGKYYVRIVSPQNSTTIYDSSWVKMYERPVKVLRDTSLCRGRMHVLDAGNAGMRYQWSTGETTRRIRTGTPGTYWVRISNGKCQVTDTMKIKLVEGAGAAPAPEVSFCLNEENKMLNIKAPPGTRIQWSTGAITPGIYITREGTYWVRTESQQCGAYTDSIRVKLKACECEMLIPNSFTPNEDNRNDYFFPVTQCDYSYYNITITDRWGNTVFSSNNISTKWDGRFKGNLCPEDIYIYKIETTEKGSDKKQVRNGHISLFR